MIKTWMKLIVICCCYYQVPANAATANIELKYYSKASYYLGQNKFKLAANQWHQLSVVFLRSEAKLGNRKMWQYAGLAEALAAISADKANDVIAYQYWADSTRYLMTGGTTWSLLQKQLHRRFETTNTQLSAFMQVNDLAVNDSDKWQQDLTMLQVWSDKLSVFTFTAPKLGLSGKRAATEVVPLQPAVNYKGAFQPNKKLTGLGASSFRGGQITPAADKVKLTTQPHTLKTNVITPSNTPNLNPIKPKVSTPRFIRSGLSQAINSQAEVQPVEHLPLVEINEIEPQDKPVIVPKSNKELEAMPSQSNPLSRGNMAVIEGENVEALQRRSFSPVNIN